MARSPQIQIWYPILLVHENTTLGTGKTFVGVKLIEAMLKSECSTPILILSYKNHSLDEFLKHLVRNLKEIANLIMLFI